MRVLRTPSQEKNLKLTGLLIERQPFIMERLISDNVIMRVISKSALGMSISYTERSGDKLSGNEFNGNVMKIEHYR